MTHEDIETYLREAGCSEPLRLRLFTLMESGNAREGLPELAALRLRLLADVRESDRRLSCLDRAIHAITAQAKDES